MRSVHTFAHRVTALPNLFRVAVLTSVMVAFHGCGHITTHRRPYSTVIDTVVLDSPPDGRVLSASRWSFEGQQLVVHIDDWQTCYRTQTQILEERVEITRTIKHDALSLTSILLGLAAIGISAYDWAEPTFLEPDDHLTRGLVMGGGLLAELPIVIGEVRARDTDEFVARRERPIATGSPFVCADGEAPPSEATLTLPDGQVLRSPRQSDGSYRFDVATQSDLSFTTTRIATLAWQGYAGEPIALPVSEAQRNAGAPTPSTHDPYFARRYPGPCSARSEVGALTFDYDGNRPVAVREGPQRVVEWVHASDTNELSTIWLASLPRDSFFLFDGPGAIHFGMRDPRANSLELARTEEGELQSMALCLVGDPNTEGACPQANVHLVSDGRDSCLGMPGQLACPVLVETILGASQQLFVRERFTYDRVGRLRAWTSITPGGEVSASAWLDWSGREVMAWRSDQQTLLFDRDEVGNVRTLRARIGEAEQTWTFDYGCWGEVSP